MNDHTEIGTLNVCVLGCGVVGTEVVRYLRQSTDELAARCGARLELTAVVVRDARTPRDPAVPTRLLRTDAEAAIDEADVVVEVIGGIDPAREYILRALQRGKSVVTANKALLAVHGAELYQAADQAGVDLGFEAAVAGAVPVVRGVRESLAGDTITRILGIVNGTTNYILDQMTTAGLEFDEALREAQELGYAEADPSADVDGLDAAAKTAILASLAFHSRTSLADVSVTGIRSVTRDDIEAARQSGHVIKLLAVAEQRQDDGARGIAVRVHPALLPMEHPMANVYGAYNAVVVEAVAAGTLMFYGAGAGGAPSASAVLGDLVAVARHRVTGGRGPAESNYARLPLLPPEQVLTRYQMRLQVRDVPGVLATISTTVAEYGISVETVRQVVEDEEQALLVLITHRASDEALAETVRHLADLDEVVQVLSVLRVEGY
ncbi:MAG TPA: homoserine dehydrogenase [Beutenbergiaceae bacterium]|nr:homoserine dehydrogenase [Beutenbergiaceae bacterium]